METAKYYIIFGLLLLAIAVSPRLLNRLPLTPAIIYLFFGITLGPHGLNLLQIDLYNNSHLIEALSEITVIVALFTVGLKLTVPFSDKRWLVPLVLGTATMVMTILAIALVSYYFLGLGVGESILLGAVLSPTDPVLASDAQLSSPEENDHLKFSLTTEGGINDGTAFPFVMLGLGIMNLNGQEWNLNLWFFKDFLYAVSLGLILGGVIGYLISELIFRMHGSKDRVYMEDFITIGSIAISYGLTNFLAGYGFLAVFANALVIRHYQMRKNKKDTKQSPDLPEDVLSFNEKLERMLEVVSVVFVGSLINFGKLSWELGLLAGFVFLIARPVSVLLTLLPFEMSRIKRLIVAWTGVRGIGSLYYCMFVYHHHAANAQFIFDATLAVIALSIVIHGVTTKPIISLWERLH